MLSESGLVEAGRINLVENPSRAADRKIMKFGEFVEFNEFGELGNSKNLGLVKYILNHI